MASIDLGARIALRHLAEDQSFLACEIRIVADATDPGVRPGSFLRRLVARVRATVKGQNPIRNRRLRPLRP